MKHHAPANEPVRLPVKSRRKRAFRDRFWPSRADTTNVVSLEWERRKRNEPDDRPVEIVRTPELLILLALLKAIPAEQLAQAKAGVFRVHRTDTEGEAARTAAHIMVLLA